MGDIDDDGSDDDPGDGGSHRRTVTERQLQVTVIEGQSWRDRHRGTIVGRQPWRGSHRETVTGIWVGGFGGCCILSGHVWSGQFYYALGLAWLG